MLGRKESMKIVDKLLMELETLLVDKDLTLNVSEKVKKKVQYLGFDKNNGARPMAKVIQEKIKVPLSEIILKSKQSSGTVFIDLNKDESFNITIKKNEKNNISINP